MVSNDDTTRKIPLHWLDLRATGISMLERLSLEEALLRHDDRNWAVVGTHEVSSHKYLKPISMPLYAKEENQDCLIVMGIGGKPDQLLNIPLVEEDSVLVCKRFSGGGTVVLDANSLWTTFIGRNEHFPHVEPYPKSIMEWSANEVFGPAMTSILKKQSERTNGKRTLVVDSKSCSATENSGRVRTAPLASESSNRPHFELRENDYVLGERKFGGNAQAIVKGGWLHHTSFLWDYNPGNMQYLSLPQKRPDYRGDRSHDDFLVTLREYCTPREFFGSVKEACKDSYDVVETVQLQNVMEEIINGKLGGMEEWWERNRTRILKEL